MKKNIFRIKKSIFSKLVISYMLFSILIVVSFISCLFIAAFSISGGNDDLIPPNDIVDENGTILDMHMIESLGGWIEKLDTDYSVTDVYGNKKTSQYQYTEHELFALTKIGLDTTEPYIGFLQYVENTNSYYLSIYERNLVQINTTVMLDQSNSANNWNSFVIVTFLLLYFLNCILLSVYLSHKIKKPLSKIVNGMDRVKAGENNVHLNFKADAEFEQIRDTFNLMIENLEISQKEKAEMEQKKAQLLLELSHDIKTPLATIKGYANALENNLVPEEKKTSYYHTIDKKADRVCSLAENMFLLLKMENADYQLILHKTDVCELLRQICAEYYEELSQSGFDVDISIPDKPAYAMLDEKAFSRVVGNLLSNAMKYNKTGKAVRIKLEHIAKPDNALVIHKLVKITVADDGTLIDEALRPTIFDAFIRGDKARKTDGGTGLGLAISKAIIEKHHGTLEYSVMDGENCFGVWLDVV